MARASNTRRHDLDVFVTRSRVGSLYPSEVDEDTFLFTYAERTKAEDAVSLTMPVVRDPYESMSAVHPIFEMSLPEGMLREKLRQLFAKLVPDFDDLGLLSIVGQSQIGRLRYAAPGKAPEDVPDEDVTRLLAHEGADDLFSDLLEKYARHSGISGVQPKVLVRARGRTRNVDVDRVTERGATHIVKAFDPRELPELAANEHFCLQAAAFAGLPTARTSLSKNRRILVVDRFDLAARGHYLGVEDFCVLSALRAHGKYDGSYELVAKRITQFVSPQHQAQALEQLFAMVALFCAVENGDGHLKNFAVLYDQPEGDVRLAPVYDVVSTTPYAPRDVLALTIDDAKDFPDRKRLVAFGTRSCNLRKKRCEAILSRVVAGVKRVLPRAARLGQKERDFSRVGRLLVAAFERGIRRLIG